MKRHVVGLGLLKKLGVVLAIISLSACASLPTIPIDPIDPNPPTNPPTNPTPTPPITTTNQVSLTVVTIGNGQGDVSGCENTCTKNYDKGTTLRMVATPKEGSTFARWLGPCVVDGNTCDLTLSDDYTTVQAEFVKDGLPPDPNPNPDPNPTPEPTTFKLNISLIGDGNGYISLDAENSSKLNCQAVTSCEAIIEKDKTVYIGAGANTGSTFQGFSGDCSGTLTCGLQMTKDMNIIASFSKEATQPPQPPPSTNDSELRITEIGYPLNIVDSSWLELYNTSDKDINLANYKLRSFSGLQADPYTAQGTREFDLPSVNVEAKSYIILRAQSYDVYVNGPDQIFLNANGIVPRWGQYGGLLEITQNGQTVDAVQWGSTTSTPLTPSAWQGNSFTPQATGVYGGSFARNINNVDSNTANDWESLLFATPGGPNDVPANAHDVDIDGIPDSSEVPGSTFAGMDLYAMGARVGTRDIFVEVDYMTSSDDGIIPQPESLQMIVDSFAKEGIAVHFDVGSALNDSRFNLGNQSVQVPYARSIEQATARSYLQDRANFYEYKGQHMEPKRGSFFHYMLMGSSRNIDGSRGSGGVAELGGNDVLITLGGWGLNKSTEANKNMLINFQASMIMHELGHNLGLEHGGDEQTNLKPNYLSIMNYLYSIYGVGPTTGENAGDRFYVYNNRKSIDFCSIAHSPCGTDFKLDYSHGRAQSMNESNIDELVGVGYGSAWVDYNDDGSQTRSGKSDINLDDNFSVITDHDDWGNLLLPFQRQIQGTAGPSQLANRNLVIPQLNDQQERIVEDAPSTSFFEALDAMNQ